MNRRPQSPIEPFGVRILRYLVYLMTVVFVAGFTVVVFVIYLRFPDGSDVTLRFPESIQLPADVSPVAFTQTRKWFAIITESDEILIFDAESGEILQRIQIVTGG